MKETSMKTKTALLRSFSVLLALLVFAALPNSVLATCSPCHDPTFTLVPGAGNQLSVQIDCDCPPGATIFYRLNSASNPTHSDATPTGVLSPGRAACKFGYLSATPSVSGRWRGRVARRIPTSSRLASTIPNYKEGCSVPTQGKRGSLPLCFRSPHGGL